jgi:hypothetical protein
VSEPFAYSDFDCRYILDSEGFYDNVGRLQAIELNTWKSIHSRVLACFQELWSCIQTVLCADAPEGHVPEELEDEASLDTKEILSYSWRGLKEARYDWKQPYCNNL